MLEKTKNSPTSFDSNTEPPEPTFDNPHLQIDWVWERFIARYENLTTVTTYRAQLNSYKQFLNVVNGYDKRLENDPRFFLSINWDYRAIHNAELFWRSIKLNHHTIAGYVRGLQQIIEFAVGEGLTADRDFIRPLLHSNPERRDHKAYNEQELILIRRIINEGVDYASKVATDYIPTHVGEDPRSNYNPPGTGKNCDQWMIWENIIWYFENVMNCRAKFGTHLVAINDHTEITASKAHKRFFKAINEHHGGRETAWKRLGVAPVIDKHLIIPLVLKLAFESGLNANSILNLKRDCYQHSHPITGHPYLRYYKPRSKGEKELHLTLFDHEKQCNSFLHHKQSQSIRETIDLLLKLTEPLVMRARPQDQNRLILLETNTPFISGHSVTQLTLGFVRSWSDVIKSRLQKSSDEVALKRLNLTRFRATKITEMVSEDFDFFRIQAAAGHASVHTTVKYLTAYEVDLKARRAIETALIQIHREYKNKMA